jgi:hypothetical protein
MGLQVKQAKVEALFQKKRKFDKLQVVAVIPIYSFQIISSAYTDEYFELVPKSVENTSRGMLSHILNQTKCM